MIFGNLQRQRRNVMKSSLLRMSRWVLVITLVMAGLTLSSGAANAADNCGNNLECRYNGNDAYAMGCAGGNARYGVVAMKYLYYKGYSVGYVQLWYSWTCGTNWSRLVITDDVYREIHVGSVSTKVVRQSTPNKTYETSYDSFHGRELRSGMVYSPRTLSHACATLNMFFFVWASDCTASA
jgi:hypothetical protein